MASHDYHFVTRWRVEGDIEEVFAIIGDSGALARWWPAVYLSVREVAPGDANDVGQELALHTKGWLPYTLKWNLRVLEKEAPRRLVIGASGDFDGRGEWTLEQGGDCVDVTFDWRLAAEKPLLKYLSWALKPIFARNHEWAMRRGEESLKLEILRRRAATGIERDAVAAPPGPSRFDAKTAACIVLCGVVLAAIWMRRQR